MKAPYSDKILLKSERFRAEKGNRYATNTYEVRNESH